MAAVKIKQKAKTIRKNKKLKMMLQVARIDISKRKNFFVSIFKSNLSLYIMGKKKDLRGNSTEKKIGQIYGEKGNLMNFKPGEGKIFV